MTTRPSLDEACTALSDREPLFHRPEICGTTRTDLEAMLDPTFVEVGASGRVYSRDHVVSTVLSRYANPPTPSPHESFEVREFRCRPVALATFLVTYLLLERTPEGVHRSRRSTLWQWRGGRWQILYHQGTPTS